MMRRVNRNDASNNTLDTINAAAFAIASSQDRVSQPSNQVLDLFIILIVLML
jgi:hypothetical protein